ncbi:HpcH/HpaI aldolase/citrate lyase family protein [Roseateles violae]|uniref:CoA ester lyase n=1 Tax=Roseateles violae TaxID=3058042 RepID=A0ABT8DWW1_9BURK|nr:CoA ester lyase [Pelomonas sp. PFR6]MDN3921484.1 CoA ester lyase [Pelomonas sp. PFR6]
MKAAAPPSPARWRSALFVPADADALLEKAHARGADALVLDLEDGVAAAAKAQARERLQAQLARLKERGATVLVRINAPPDEMTLDLAAAVAEGVSAIVVPKVRAPADIDRVAEAMRRAEIARGLPPEGLPIVALIEDVFGLARLDEIAASSPRLCAMALGGEDFSASIGIEPGIEALTRPCQDLVYACARYGLQPLGFPGSIANYRDLELLRSQLALARKLGLDGAFCIHPNQVALLNEAFSPTPQQLREAARVIEAYLDGMAQGRGAVGVGGQMIDRPVFERAQALLARHQQHP